MTEPSLSDAFRKIARDGTASGPAIDALRRQITEGPPVSESPDPGRLAEATRTVLDGLGGSGTIEGAYSAMQANARRRDVVETVSPGGLGRVDPLAPSTAKALDRLDKLLKGQ